MDLDVVPDHIIILSGSYIGLEFAQVFRRFGTKVTVLEAAPRFLGREDADIADHIHGVLTGEGVRIEVGITACALPRPVRPLPHRRGRAGHPDRQSSSDRHRTATEH